MLLKAGKNVLNGTLPFQVVTNKSQCLKVSRHLMKDSFPIEIK
jgi:hypothetical protein